MAVDLLVSNVVSGNKPASVSLTIGAGAYKILVFAGALSYWTGVPSGYTAVAWNSTALTEKSTHTFVTGGYGHRSTFWYLLDPEEGAYTVTFSYSGGTGECINSVYCLTGVKQQALGAVVTDDGIQQETGTMDVTKVRDGWALDVFSVSHPTDRAMVQGAGQTEIQEGFSSFDWHNNGACSYEDSTTTTTTMSYSWGIAADFSALGTSVDPQPMGGSRMILSMSSIYDKLRNIYVPKNYGKLSLPKGVTI